MWFLWCPTRAVTDTIEQYQVGNELLMGIGRGAASNSGQYKFGCCLMAGAPYICCLYDLPRGNSTGFLRSPCDVSGRHYMVLLGAGP